VRSPDKPFSTVYYSNFWYSRFYRASEINFGGDIIRDEFDRHKERIKTLSLFFEKIYIPRGHLLTFYSDSQQSIDELFLKDREIGFLFENGQIVVSSFPGLDGKQDNERILKRSDEAVSVRYPSDKKYLDAVPITNLHQVDSLAESNSNTISFPEYGKMIRDRHPLIANRFLESFKRANINGIPFFHEDFIGMLREEFTDETVFDKLWRDTNSIYLTTGGIGHNDIIAYFNEEIESTNFRFRPHYRDRYLYSPTSLMTFLQIFLKGNEFSNFLYGDFVKLTGFRYANQEFANLWAAFRREYQALVEEISMQTRHSVEFHRDLNQRTVDGLYDFAVKGRFKRGSTNFAAFLDDAGNIAKAADVSGAGVISSLAKAGFRVGQNAVEAFTLRQRFPGLSQFLNVLRGNLKQGRNS
jgi:hypothetical protein